jgi:hypothetical protein
VAISETCGRFGESQNQTTPVGVQAMTGGFLTRQSHIKRLMPFDWLGVKIVDNITCVMLVLVGLLFAAGILPLVMILWRRDQSSYGDAMMLSLCVPLGIFLLLAVRNPSANASLIAFAAWASFAQGAFMAALAYLMPSERVGFLGAVAVLVLIGVALIVLAPAKPLPERASLAGT